MTEKVNHPDHYNQLDVECIDVVEHFSFNLGSAMKYIWRAGLKQGEPADQDLNKAAWYIQRELERLDKRSKQGT